MDRRRLVRGGGGRARDRRLDQPARGGRGHDAEHTDERADRRRQREAGEHRRVGEPRQRPHHEPHPPERDVEEGAHQARVELLAGAAGDLAPRLPRRGRLLVRARRRDHVEDVRDRDDSPGERDLLTGEPVRIPVAVPALVVVADRLEPWAEPPGERRHELVAVLRMALEDLPLVVTRTSRLRRGSHRAPRASRRREGAQPS